MRNRNRSLPGRHTNRAKPSRTKSFHRDRPYRAPASNRNLSCTFSFDMACSMRLSKSFSARRKASVFSKPLTVISTGSSVHCTDSPTTNARQQAFTIRPTKILFLILFKFIIVFMYYPEASSASVLSVHCIKTVKTDFKAVRTGTFFIEIHFSQRFA